MNKISEQLLKKKKQDKKVMIIFSIETGIFAAIFLVIGIVLEVNENIVAGGILALFAVFLLFCAMGIFIIYFIKREIKFIEHPELKVEQDKKGTDKASDEMVRNSHERLLKSKEYRINQHTDETEEDSLSMEEIDFFESDIYDDK